MSAIRMWFLALVLGVKFHQFRVGVMDGIEQGFEISVGMTYLYLDHQFAYDTGTWIGTCWIARHTHD